MRVLNILNNLKIRILSVKYSRSGSMYIDTEIGFIRYSDHSMFKFKASNRKVDVKLLIQMSSKEIVSRILNRRFSNA